MIPALESTRIGLTNPNSTMDAAICATCSGECVRAFLAYGTSRSVGQISMRRAIAGVMVAGSVDMSLVARRCPPFRAPLARVAPSGSGLAGWATCRHGRA